MRRPLVVLVSSVAAAAVACSPALPPDDLDDSRRAASGRASDATGEKSPTAHDGRPRSASSDPLRRDGGGSDVQTSLEPGDPPEPLDGAAERTDPRPGSGRGPSGTGAGARVAAAPTPRSGRYTYAQQGWEEFCSGTCNRSELPPTQTVDSSVARTGPDGFRIVTESRSSGGRSVRSTSTLSPSSHEIAKVELRYGTFSSTYRPTPPVRSLVLPLKVGDEWSSSWTAETSGRYEARVVGREPLVVDGRRIPTFKLETVTRLRGELRGTLSATVWVDPDTVATVRTSGTTRITMDLGRFASRFDTMLLEGPGY